MWLSKVDDEFNRQQHGILNALQTEKIRNTIFKAIHLDVRIDRNKTEFCYIIHTFCVLIK